MIFFSDFVEFSLCILLCLTEFFFLTLLFSIPSPAIPFFFSFGSILENNYVPLVVSCFLVLSCFTCPCINVYASGGIITSLKLYRVTFIGKELHLQMGLTVLVGKCVVALVLNGCRSVASVQIL